MRDTGLLASRETGNGSDVSVYKYGSDGHVASVVYSTGEECLFARSQRADTVFIDNSCDGSRLQITQRNRSLDIQCGKRGTVA